MLYYDRININEGLDDAKRNNSKQCMACHYWLFNHELKFHDFFCNVSHDLIILCLSISNIVIISVKGVNALVMALANLKQFVC